MTKQIINTTPHNSGSGDPGFAAFEKCNANFTELYNSVSTSALSYGADPTGATDSTTAIQNAINAVTLLGGGTVLLPAGSYTIGTANLGLSITSSNVQLVGAGSGYLRNGSTTTSSSATLLTWAGTSQPTIAMLGINSPSGATLFAIEGSGCSGIQFDCKSLAGFGLQLTSHKSGRFAQLYVINPITAAYQLTTLLNANLVDTDTQHNIFTQCYWRCIDTAASKKAHGLWLTNALPTSSTNGNTSFNTFIECLGQTDGLATNSSGVGIKIDAGDNNVFYSVINYRSSGSTVPSIQLNGYSSSSDGNVFFHFSDTTPANAINILGNATLGSGYNPTQNTFFAVDSSNGVNYPTLDTGCRVNWTNTNGISQKAILTGAVLAGLGNDPNALAQVANVVNESYRVYNASQDHVLWADGSGTPWGTNIDGSENFRFSRLAGSGNVVTGSLFISAFTTAPPTNGLATCGIGCSSTTNLGLYFGSGAPTFSAAEGAIYSNTTGSAGARLYVNTSSGSGTTWTALTTP